MASEEFYPRDFEGVWIPKEIYLNEKLNALEKIIFTEINSLDRHLSGGDYCYASNEYLAKFCGCSTRKITYAISDLIKYGFIQVVKTDGRKRWIKSLLKERLAKFASQNSEVCEADEQTMRESNISSNTNYKYTNKENIENNSQENCPSMISDDVEEKAGRWMWQSDKQYIDYMKKIMPKYIREIANECYEDSDRAYNVYIQIFTEYFKKYRAYNDKYHPWYRKEAINSTIDDLHEFFGTVNVNEVKEYMKQFFSHDDLQSKPMKVFTSYKMLEVLRNEIYQDWSEYYD